MKIMRHVYMSLSKGGRFLKYNLMAHHRECSAQVVAEADAFLRKTLKDLENRRCQTAHAENVIDEKNRHQSPRHDKSRLNQRGGIPCLARATIHVIEMLEDPKHRYVMRRFANRHADLGNKTIDMNHIDHINRSRMTPRQLDFCLKSFRSGWKRRERDHGLLMFVLKRTRHHRFDIQSHMSRQAVLFLEASYSCGASSQ